MITVANGVKMFYNKFRIKFSEVCKGMKSIRILLDTTDKVNSFVKIISSFDYDADVRSGRYVVNAKSILGIFSLDCMRPVVLEIYANDCDDLLEQLAPFMVK